jgi:hypothetical protein
MSRDASKSMNGYMYQRYYTILTFLDNINNDKYEYMMEEGYEDIDIIENTGIRTLIQIKYLEKATSEESLTNYSGLMKVITSDDNINNNKKIEKIEYKIYNPYGYHKELNKAFKNRDRYNIGKYILLLRSKKEINKNEKDKMNIDIRYINNTKKLNEWVKLYKNEIKKDELYKHFIKKKECNDYFSKFSLEEVKSYDNLIYELRNKIEKIYNESFIKHDNKKFKREKINILINKIFQIFTEDMFNRVAQNNDGKLLISDIKKNINKTIKRLKNKNNLLAEYLNSCEDQLFNKKITTQYKENIIDEINKDIKDKLSVIRFYCDIINKWKKLKDKQDLNIDINEINDKVIKHIFNQSKKEQYTNIDDIKKYYNVMGNCINLNNVYP